MVYVTGTNKQISFNCSKSNMVGRFRLTDEYTCHWQEGSDIWKSNKYFFLTLQQPLFNDTKGRQKTSGLSLLAVVPLPRQQLQGDLVFCGVAYTFSLKQINSLKAKNQ